MSTSLLTNATSYTVGSSTLLSASPSESFVLTSTAQGNYLATVVLEQSVDNITFTQVKVFSIVANNASIDSYSVNIPTNYYVRATLSSINGTNAKVSVSVTQVAYSNPIATLSTDANNNPIGIVNPKDGRLSLVADPLIQKIKNSIAKARVKNAVDSAPLVPVSAWQTATAYQVGQVVTNAGIQYICGASISSSATAPTGTGASGTQGGLSPIADGSGFWCYQGVARTTVAQSNAPTVNSGTYFTGYASSNTYQKYDHIDYYGRRWMALSIRANQTTDPNGQWFSPSLWQLLDKFDLASNPNSFFVSGGVPVLGTALNGFSTHTFLQANGSSGIPTVSFETTSPFVIFNGNQIYSPNYGFKIEVDGVRLSDSLIASATTSEIVLDFSAQPIKSRVIKLSRLGYANVGAAFGGIYVATGHKVTAPKNINRFRMGFVGDSYLQGGGSPVSNNPLQDLGVPMQVATLLGCDDAYSFAIGGCGFLNATTHFSHITEMIASNPDVLVIFGAANDGGFTSAQRVAAFTTFLTTFRVGCPNSIILFFGTWSISTAGTKVDTEADQLTVFNALKDSRMFYIPVTTDPQGAWNDGAGKVDTVIAYPPTATGSAMLYTGTDGVHQTPIGTDYIAKRIVAAVENTLL